MNREFVLDRFDPAGWREAASGFGNYNLYQVWEYAAHHSPPSSTRGVIRCAVVRDGNRMAAMGQFRVKTIPVVGWGTAELEWGPLWDPASGEEAWEDVRYFFDCVRDELVSKRKLEVRLYPHTTFPEDLDDRLGRLIEEAGFETEITGTRNYDTVMVDLSKDLETLRGDLHPKWRNLLKKAEKSDLAVELGRDPDLFDRFVDLYEAMRRVKDFPTGVRIPVVRAIQAEAAPSERFLVAVASKDGRDVGASVCAVTGNRMLYFLGATDPDHRESSPGHLLQWEIVRRGKELGVRWYDLGGLVDEGVTRFKVRMGGTPVSFPRRYVARPGALRSAAFQLAEKGFGWIRG